MPNAPWKHGGREYTWDELLSALGLLDEGPTPGQGHYVRSPLDLAAVTSRAADSRYFSYDPVAQQLSWDPNYTPEQAAMLGEQEEWPGIPQSSFYLKTPTGGKAMPITTEQLDRYLNLEPEMQERIASLSPEDFMRLRGLEGEAAPGVRDEGPTPPGEPASGQSTEDWLRERRKEINERFGMISNNLAGATGRIKTGEGNWAAPMQKEPIEMMSRLMLTQGYDPDRALAEYNRLMGVTDQPPAYTIPGGGKSLEERMKDWLGGSPGTTWQQDMGQLSARLLDETAKDLVANEGITMERARRQARKRLREKPSSGAASTGMISSTWG